MSDIDSSLPIRTLQPGDVIAKIADANTPSQQLAVNLDGSINSVVTATNLDIRDLAFATDKVDVSGSSVDIANTVTVQATDLDIRNLSASQDNVAISDGTDTLAINTDGSINVVVQNTATTVAVQDFNTATVNGGVTSTHTYTATANFTFTQVEASASDRLKIEVRVNGVTKAVQFNSSAETNMSIIFSQPLTITTGQTIQVLRTNRASQQDVYSTIIGYN
jgi:hypothetical protein